MSKHKPTLRVIDTLEFVASGGGATLTEISKALSIPSSTLYPILQTMRDTRYLHYDPTTQRYELGIRAFEIGSSYIQSSEAYQNIVDILQNITESCGETSHFGVLEKGDVLYLAKVDSPNPIRMYSAVGRRLPAYGTGLGKALLCDKTREELEELYPDGLHALTENTITDMDILQKELEEIQRTGVAYEVEESNEMIRCVAVPIYFQGVVVASLSVPIPIFRFTEEKEEEVEQLLRSAAVHVGRFVQYINLK